MATVRKRVAAGSRCQGDEAQISLSSSRLCSSSTLLCCDAPELLLHLLPNESWWGNTDLRL